MAIIELTRGYQTVVDDEFFEELNSFNWYASGKEGRPARRLRAGNRKLIYMYHQILHVLPWVMKDQGFEIDHIDNNPLNNLLSNLRVVTHKENMRNTRRIRQGVCFDSTHGKYKAYLDRPDMPRINVGTFKTEEEAQASLAKYKEELSLESN